MAIKLFWTYIGSLLMLSIALSILVKRFAEGYASSGKKPYFYGTISSALASGAAYLSTLISGHLFTVFWVLAAVFLVFGIIHMAIVHKKYFYANKHNSSKVFKGEVFFGISVILFTIAVFSSLQYFLKEDKTFLFYPMMLSSLAFFIPLMVMHTFDAAIKIPAAIFPTWEYPLDSTIELPEEKAGEQLWVIGFMIAKKKADTKKTFFRAKAIDRINLGELYYHFINDYNELQSETPIEFADYNRDAHQWWFRRKPKWYQFQKILNPDISVRENRIKENTVIICERITNPDQE